MYFLNIFMNLINGMNVISLFFSPSKNYGTEHNANKLLMPYKYAFMGLSEADFSMQRTREDVREKFINK